MGSMCFCVFRSSSSSVPQGSTYVNSTVTEQLQSIYENGEDSQMTWIKVGRVTWGRENWVMSASQT